MKKNRKLADIKCPKCKRKPTKIMENTVGSISYVLEKNKYIDWEIKAGDITSMSAFCKECNHTWKLRGILQITDFIDYE